MSDRFSAEAWDRAAPWFEAILRHPFLSGLRDGTLPPEAFHRYLIDDAHYLLRYATALTTVASRWPDAQGAAALARFAIGAVEAERALHATVLTADGIDLNGPDVPEPSPVCLAYANTLQTAASLAPIGVAMAGLLPCFRVYAEVGARLTLTIASTADHPYREWVVLYGDPAFATDARRAEDLADAAADLAGPAERATMHDAYAQATRFEWMFWDGSYAGQDWPVPG